MQTFQNTKMVKITDQALNQTPLHEACGVVVNEDGPFLNVFITTGQYMGQTHRFLAQQLCER